MLPDSTRKQGAGHADGLEDIETCASCHPEVAAAFTSNAHAFASLSNPIYRESVNTLRDEEGFEASRMCAGCHDPVLLVNGLMDTSFDLDDERSAAGVSCRVCHGAKAVALDGNGSYSLSATPLVLPASGSDASILAHRKSVRPLGNELCAACHRSFLSRASGNASFLPGADDWGAWQSSAYAKNGAERLDRVEAQDCIDCHMPYEQTKRGDAAAKRIRSHRFAGGHTLLASHLGDSAALAAHRSNLAGAVSMDIAAFSLEKYFDDAGQPTGGKELSIHLSFDLVLVNETVGHRFPGGTTDAQNTWVEIKVFDAKHKLLRVAGISDGNPNGDLSTHVLRSYVSDESGKLVRDRSTHNFVAPIADHTIGPRDAALIRYEGALPGNFVAPLEVEARLLHQSRSHSVHKLLCAATKAPCTIQPTTLIAKTSRVLRTPDSDDDFERFYNHGRAWLHDVQENLERARPIFQRARSLVSDDFQRAKVHQALGVLEGRLGRADEALAQLDAAESLIGENPALDAARGRALARVWRWSKAADSLAKSTQKRPKNLSLWRELATALGSLGRHSSALEAAQKGLALSPRDSDLLRTQALALRALSSPDADEALDAYESFRIDDRRDAIKQACAQKTAICQLEQRPVHSHRLRAP